MPASKTKNIIIFILALAVVFLLLLVVPTKMAQLRDRQSMRGQLTALFASHGVRLNGETLTEGQNLAVIEWSEPQRAGAQCAAALLDHAMLLENSSSHYVSSYSGTNGACTIGADGSFTASLQGSPEVGDLRADAEKLLRRIGFICAEISEPRRISAGVYELQCTQSIQGVPVFSDGLCLRYENGSLTAISGTFFCGEDKLVRVGAETCISCADALTAFLSQRDALGWVGSEILSVRQGFRHTDTAAANVRMTPAWRIETDTGAFFVGGVSREVTPG